MLIDPTRVFSSPLLEFRHHRALGKCPQISTALCGPRFVAVLRDDIPEVGSKGQFLTRFGDSLQCFRFRSRDMRGCAHGPRVHDQ